MSWITRGRDIEDIKSAINLLIIFSRDNNISYPDLKGLESELLALEELLEE